MSKRPRQHWRIDMHASAWKQFNALTYEQKQGVFDAMLPVLEADNPEHAPGVKKLEGKFRAFYRVRARTHRVVFEILRRTIGRFRGTLYIADIVDRKDAY